MTLGAGAWHFASSQAHNSVSDQEGGVHLAIKEGFFWVFVFCVTVLWLRGRVQSLQLRCSHLVPLLTRVLQNLEWGSWLVLVGRLLCLCHHLFLKRGWKPHAHTKSPELPRGGLPTTASFEGQKLKIPRAATKTTSLKDSNPHKEAILSVKQRNVRGGGGDGWWCH